MQRKTIAALVTIVVVAVLALYFYTWSRNDGGSENARPIPVVRPPTPPPALPKPEVSLPPEPAPATAPESPPELPEEPETSVPPDRRTPADWVRQLGAASAAGRRDAAAALRRLGTAALPALQAERESTDPELRDRVQTLLAEMYVTAFLTDRQTRPGRADEPNTNREWPCVVQVTAYDEATGTFVGQIEWPTLKALHAIEGTRTGDQLTFKETKFIKQGEAALNCVYEFPLPTANRTAVINGQWRDPNSGRGGRVVIALDGALPEKPKTNP